MKVDINPESWRGQYLHGTTWPGLAWPGFPPRAAWSGDFVLQVHPGRSQICFGYISLPLQPSCTADKMCCVNERMAGTARTQGCVRAEGREADRDGSSSQVWFVKRVTWSSLNNSVSWEMQLQEHGCCSWEMPLCQKDIMLIPRNVLWPLAWGQWIHWWILGKMPAVGAAWLLSFGDAPKREMMGIYPARGKKWVPIPIQGNPNKICKLELGSSPVPSLKDSSSELPTGTNPLPFPNHVRKWCPISWGEDALRLQDDKKAKKGHCSVPH